MMTETLPAKKEQARPVEYSALNSLDDERAVLGAVLLKPEESVKNFRKLSKDLFYDYRIQKIFEVCRIILAEGGLLSEQTLILKLKKEGNEALDEAGGLDHVVKLTDYCPTVYNLPYHLEILRDLAARRSLFRQNREHLKMIGDFSIKPEQLIEKFNKTSKKTLRATASGNSKIKFISPKDAREYHLDKKDILVGNSHITRGTTTVIGGPPAVGKSRAATALAVAGATQQDWFGLTVHKKFKTLIIQAENSISRLKSEMSDLPYGLDDYLRISIPPSCGLAFNDSRFKSEIEEMCEEFLPDLVVIDPWNRVAKGDDQREYSYAFDNVFECFPDPKPAIVIVAHTRKPKDGGGKGGRELLHELSGSLLLGSVARSVFILTAATNETEDDRVIWFNPKNNDGKMVERSVWHRCNGIFTPCGEFDWNLYDKPEEGKTAIGLADVEALFKSGNISYRKNEAVKELMAQTGKGKTACYDALNLNGKYGNWIREKEGLLTWANHNVSAFPLSVSAPPKGEGGNGN